MKEVTEFFEKFSIRKVIALLFVLFVIYSVDRALDYSIYYKLSERTEILKTLQELKSKGIDKDLELKNYYYNTLSVLKTTIKNERNFRFELSKLLLISKRPLKFIEYLGLFLIQSIFVLHALFSKSPSLAQRNFLFLVALALSLIYYIIFQLFEIPIILDVPAINATIYLLLNSVIGILIFNSYGKINSTIK